MSPREKQIAIAKVCGWQVITDSAGTHNIPPNTSIVEFMGMGEPLLDLPDYLNDLNAMHEAEKVLTEEQNDKYLVILSWSVVSQAEMAHRATATQRAEAFGLTLNLWTK